MKKTFILSLVVLSMSMASNEIIDIENKLNPIDLDLKIMDDPKKQKIIVLIPLMAVWLGLQMESLLSI